VTGQGGEAFVKGSSALVFLRPEYCSNVIASVFMAFLQANDVNEREWSSGGNLVFARRLCPIVRFISLSDEFAPLTSEEDGFSGLSVICNFFVQLFSYLVI
jgi:hypothetical protein